MDELEKKIIEKYGTGTISAEECMKIMNKAAQNGLIERKDIKPMPSMNSSELIEHIFSLRRKFLISDGFSMNMEEEIYDSLSSSSENKEKGKILDKVLRAFLEYEKCRTVPQKRRSYFISYVFIFVLFILFGFISYTPAPY